MKQEGCDDMLVGAVQAENVRLKKNFHDYYCVPKWCRMPPMSHFDGMGGCWSISSGLVLNKGEKACMTCEYHGKK